MLSFVLEILLILMLLTALHFFIERPKLQHKLTVARHLYLISCQMIATTSTVIAVVLLFGTLKATEAQTGSAIIVTFLVAHVGFYRLFERDKEDAA